MAKLKFGSKAWRAKYLKKGKRKNAPKRKTAKKRATKKRSTSHSRGTAYKKKRMKEMLRSNPPRKWTKVKSVRVVRKGGRDILEIRK